MAIRANLDFELKTSGMKMGGGPKPFGVDAERVPGMLTALTALPLDFVGFHIFSGSQNLRPEAIMEARSPRPSSWHSDWLRCARPVRAGEYRRRAGRTLTSWEQRLELASIATNLAG